MTTKKKVSAKKISKIKLLLTDVDGVLTDGGMYYTEEGLVMKKFNVKDGMGVYLLQQKGIETGIISTDNSPILKARGKRLKLSICYDSILDKKAKLDEICKERNLSYDEVAFIGDDVNDCEILNKVGFSAAPSDAVDAVISIVDYVCSKKGGEGAFREIAELILKHKK